MGCFALVRCVLVLRCGLVGVVWYQYAGWNRLHTDTTTPQPNHNVTPTHIDQVCVSSYIRHQNMCRKHYQKHNTQKENSITIRNRTSQHLQRHATQTTTHVTTKHSTPNNYANASTSILTEQYNPWKNSSNKSQAPEDWCINIRNMLSII